MSQIDFDQRANPVGSFRPRTTGGGATLFQVALFLSHIPLGLLMLRLPQVADVHAIAVLLLGLWWAISGQKPERVAYVGAYITGAEVLWRLSHASVFWEFGKYATVCIFVVSFLRRGSLKVPALPIIYFALLLPSVALTMAELDLAQARDQISFNLSGPFALMISACFFSRLKLSRRQSHQLLCALMAPVVSIASITIVSTFRAASLQFSDRSNFETSGNFGPNQVSAILGLAGLLAFLLLTEDRARSGLKQLMMPALLIFATQSAMTFSRGGLYSAVGAALLASVYLFRKAGTRVRLVTIICVVFAIGAYILVPLLDTFTGGALSVRFGDTSLTGRDRLVQSDLQAWEENPIFGVGPGRARSYRALVFRSTAAHTEFSRLFAEHGTAGVAAFAALLFMAIQSLRRARTATHKALVAAMIAWSFLYMSTNGMRLVAPSFVFGLTWVKLSPGVKWVRWILPGGVRSQRRWNLGNWRRPVEV